jgi:hypothetical protein
MFELDGRGWEILLGMPSGEVAADPPQIEELSEEGLLDFSNDLSKREIIIKINKMKRKE